jgi:4-aminobutyrate aminotransferase / (S)-3-amino-2-methylpropionate transaminase / 5-aminovalerate transaminase
MFLLKKGRFYKMTKLTGPKIVTAVPGPKSQEILASRDANVPKTVSTAVPAVANRGQGALLEDVDGNVFVDFVGGIGVLNIGYSHPEVVEVVKEQAEKFFHTSINAIAYEQYIKLAEKLNEIIPIDGPKKTIFVNTGAEADENAIKLAREFTGRSEIICFSGAFHGRTNLTMALTSKVKPYKNGYGPFTPGVHRIPFPYCYRCPHGQERETCNMFCASKLEDFFMEYVVPEEVACIIMEPIQGEGGFVIPPEEYVVAIRNICDKYGILLISDEVQAGFCRTGKMFASEYWPVKPDIVTTAKSLAGGMPLSAVTARADLMDAAHPGGLGGTYSGNPLSTAAGLKIVEIMERDNLADRANEIGATCMERFYEMKEKYDIIGDVRGRGAMMAIEFVKDRGTKEPNKEAVGQIMKECYQNGLLTLSAGVRGNNIRFLMPLVITDEQLNAGLEILENAVAKVAGAAEGMVAAAKE